MSVGDPANLEECIAVGSVHGERPHLYGISAFSSRGPTSDGRAKPDVVAPGERILSCNSHWKTGDKAHYRYDPYFYIELNTEYKEEFLGFLDKNYRAYFKNIEEVKKVNLERIEHMTGQKTSYHKITFDTTSVVCPDQNLVYLRKKLATEHDRVKKQKMEPNLQNLYSCILDIREYDVLYRSRVMIDQNIRVAFWYKVTIKKCF